MSKLITEKDALLAAFPYSLTRDTDKVKLADAVASELIKTVAQSEYAAIFPRVDELPEKVLDILAADLKIQWYEADSSIESKALSMRLKLLCGVFMKMSRSLNGINTTVLLFISKSIYGTAAATRRSANGSWPR